jgi:hypothetical protein
VSQRVRWRNHFALKVATNTSQSVRSAVGSVPAGGHLVRERYHEAATPRRLPTAREMAAVSSPTWKRSRAADISCRNSSAGTAQSDDLASNDDGATGP